MSAIRRSLMNAKGSEELPNYLCFTALEDGTFSLAIPASVDTNYLNSMSYSLDEGETWVKTDNNSTAITITTPTVTAGNKVLWKGDGIALSKNSWADCSVFSSTKTCNISGNLFSLVYGDKCTKLGKNIPASGWAMRLFQSIKCVDVHELELPAINLLQYAYRFLFNSCTSLVNAGFVLPTESTNVGNIYDNMFAGCSKLEIPPIIKLKTSASFAFTNMFYNCKALVTIPNFDFEIGGYQAFSGTFSGCTALKYIGKFPKYANKRYSFRNTFKGCTSLEEAPELLDLELAQYDYENMFDGCTKLSWVKMLATNISSAVLTNWLRNVAATGVFVKNINATWNDSGVVPTGWTVIYFDPSDNKYYTNTQKTQECDDHGNPI